MDSQRIKILGYGKSSIKPPIDEQDRRMMAMIFFLTIGALPIGFDGFYQLLTDYESTNPIRLITGTIAGFVLSWWFCAAVSSKTQDFTDSSQVKLPANARLVFKD